MTFLRLETTLDMPPVCVQKEIQMVLEERSLWPSLRLTLCEKQKSFSFQTITNYKLYIKGKKCESYIKPREHTDKCVTNRICDGCVCRKKCCQYIKKKYCTQYKEYDNKKSC